VTKAPPTRLAAAERVRVYSHDLGAFAGQYLREHLRLTGHPAGGRRESGDYRDFGFSGAFQINPCNLGRFNLIIL
jgi:hypothetical protein